MACRTFTFQSIPSTFEEFKTLKEAKLWAPFETAAMTLLALMMYENNKEASLECLNYLKGPAKLSPYEKQFFEERLRNAGYKARSFFKGATRENNYTPSVPYQIEVHDNPYSYPEENWATVYVTSSGADSPRPIKLRFKPSTHEWFLNEVQILTDIRIPLEQDIWA